MDVTALRLGFPFEAYAKQTSRRSRKRGRAVEVVLGCLAAEAERRVHTTIPLHTSNQVDAAYRVFVAACEQLSATAPKDRVRATGDDKLLKTS